MDRIVIYRHKVIELPHRITFKQIDELWDEACEEGKALNRAVTLWFGDILINAYDPEDDEDEDEDEE